MRHTKGQGEEKQEYIVVSCTILDKETISDVSRENKEISLYGRM
jgi:hypothetical protein